MFGKDITIGTRLLWHVEVGTYYKETHEVIRTVESITDSNTPWCDATMTFVEDHKYPKSQWFIKNDKEYQTRDAYQNKAWLDGDPNNPL